MHCPVLQAGRGTVETQDVFLGLHRKPRIQPGEFYDMKNLTSDLTPVMSPRRPRGVVIPKGNFQGLAGKDTLYYVEGSELVMNGARLELGLSQKPEDCPKQLISMGAYLIILPDKKYVNTADRKDHGSMEAEVTTEGPVTISQCSLDGAEILPEFVGPDLPKTPTDRSYWLDTGSQPPVLKQYAKATDLWIVVENPYVKLGCPGIGKGFSRYDGVQISGLTDEDLKDLNGANILYERGDDFLVVPGLLSRKLTQETPVKIRRAVPQMDFVVESGNRLWGCRYGPNEQGQVVNEIYASKLGDFKNWSCYLGISTDSYTVSLGSDGPFTGAITHGGHPLFFKEKCVHKIFGQMPANFQVQTVDCRGVQAGCHRSLAIVGEVLYYKSPTGICAYDGSLPQVVSEPLGEISRGRAVGAAVGNKYYISMEQGKNWELLVFDTARGLWHREDDLAAYLMCPCREELFCVDQDGRLLALLGTLGQPEGPVSWMAQTGVLGSTLPGNKYLGPLGLRMLLDPGSRVTVQAQYDSAGPWENLGTVQGMNLRSFVLPVVPRRCDHLRLRLLGEGNAMVFSVTRTVMPGSDAG